MKILSYKSKQFFFVLIKLSIVLLAFLFIFDKLVNNSELSFSQFLSVLIESDILTFKNIIFLFVLSFFNWFIEILKWKQLVSPIKLISFNDAFKQSLSSLTASIFTPNRIGEYGAKAMYYLPKKRKHILLINLMSNMMQMCATLIFGACGLVLFTEIYNLDLDYYRISFLIITIGLITVLTTYWLKRKPIVFRGISLHKIKKFVFKFPKPILFKGQFFSIIRYGIFSFQFYFLLHLFHDNIHYFEAIIIISTMYIIVSIIPTIILFDVVIKGSVAVYLFRFIGINEFTILSIITLMWLLNFVIPSIIGSYFVLGFKTQKPIN